MHCLRFTIKQRMSIFWQFCCWVKKKPAGLIFLDQKNKCQHKQISAVSAEINNEKNMEKFLFSFKNCRFSSLSSSHCERCQKTFKRMKIQKLRYIINTMSEWSQDRYIKMVMVSQWCRYNLGYEHFRNNVIWSVWYLTRKRNNFFIYFLYKKHNYLL